MVENISVSIDAAGEISKTAKPDKHERKSSVEEMTNISTIIDCDWQYIALYNNTKLNLV